MVSTRRKEKEVFKLKQLPLAYLILLFQYRKELLEAKLKSSNLFPEQCENKKQQLANAETGLMRLRRIRLNVNSFESLKIIGRGASGEVSLKIMSFVIHYNFLKRFIWYE